MAHSLPTLNPPKTLNRNLKSINQPIFFLSQTSLPSKITKFKKYPSITMSSQHQNLVPHVALTNNDQHKEEVMTFIKNSISNCLSETHLHLTVPQLNSKIRGKVIHTQHFHSFCFSVCFFFFFVL